MAKWFQSKQARAGSYSATFVIVFVAILAAVNYLAVKYNKTYDATQLKLYSLSDQTLRVLAADRDKGRKSDRDNSKEAA